ncbi:MAG TPA: hypothetical protein VN256_19475 [Pyrinomonadaceae bacterium]|nr:hypothetical protein [Pyrinomonadaceae bacterium]
MNRRFNFSILAVALVALAAVAFVVGHNAGTRAAGVNGALAALPASDFVIGIDAQRALNETLPALLASNPAALAKVNTELEEFQRKTGINPRTFESIAIGGSFPPDKSRGNGRAVVIARGSFRADELLETAFAAAKAKEPRFQKEEQLYEGRTIFLVGQAETPRTTVEAQKKTSTVTRQSEPAAATPPNGSGAGIGPDQDSKAPPLEVLEGDHTVRAVRAARRDRVAVTVLDANTIAAGDLDGVRAAIDASLGRNRVDDELVRLASETPGAVVGFSGRVPQNFGGKVGDSVVEKYFASIRQFYGSLGADGMDAQARVTLRTETAEQANDIGQALNALKTLSAVGFAGPGSKNASVGDLIKSLNVTTLNNEVQISVKIPQAIVTPVVKSL